MTHLSDPRSVLDAAQEAATAGDHEAAERLLRKALAQQEADLGPLHPDLANTLNNLAVVCEQREKFDDAERGYRRAHAIVVASLSPGHPLVATSLKNLVDFCVARGIPLWTPPAARQDVSMDSPAPAAPPRPELPVEAEVRPEPAVRTRLDTRRVAAILALSVGLLLALLLVIEWPGSDASTETSLEAEPVPVPPPPSRTPALTPSAAPAPVPTREPEPTTPPRETNPRQASAGIERDPISGTATPSAPVIVLTAHVCGAFEKRGSPDWQCTPVGEFSQAGTFTFYTRLLTESDTTVEHRWYHGDRLQRTMKLSVRGTGSKGDGYRTYSQKTVSPGLAGDWKVEVRASDGTSLQEEHFVVR